MSQHDYVIDNQLTPAFRSDLNSVLAAIVSSNSGVTAPTTTYANMFWYDTTNDLLKIRNEANSAWITMGTVDQTNNVFNPNFLPATQAEAEAGTNNVKGMTALRSAQAIAALGGLAGVNIQAFTASGTYTPTSGYKYGIAFVTGGGADGGISNQNCGGAGATAIGVLDLTALGAVAATVGANGSTGGASTLSTLSGGGGASATSGTPPGVGGTATGGILNVRGGDGSNVTSGGGHSFWGGGMAQGATGGRAFGSGGSGSSTNRSLGTSGVIMIMEFK